MALIHEVEDASVDNGIHSSLSSFFTLLDTVYKPLFGKTSYFSSTKDHDQKSSDFEFDHMCADKRKHFLWLLKHI